jgi:hypothetical protein
MKVFEYRSTMTAPVFGFMTENESIIRVDEVVIEQDYNGSEE